MILDDDDFGKIDTNPKTRDYNNYQDFLSGAKWGAREAQDKIFGNGHKSMDAFLLNTESFSQEERELVMEVISEYELYLYEQ